MPTGHEIEDTVGGELETTLDPAWEIYKTGLDYCTRAVINARRIFEYGVDPSLDDSQKTVGLYIKAARSLIEISGVDPPPSVTSFLKNEIPHTDINSDRGIFSPESGGSKPVKPSEKYLSARKEGKILYFIDGEEVLVDEGEPKGNSHYAVSRGNPQDTRDIESDITESRDELGIEKPEITHSKKRNAEYLTSKIIETINTNYQENLTEDDFRTIYVQSDKKTKTEAGFYLVMSRVYGIDTGKSHGTLSRQDSSHGKIRVLSGRGDYRNADIFSSMTEPVYRAIVDEIRDEGGVLPDTWRGDNRQWTYTMLSDSIYGRLGPVKVARVVNGDVVISHVVKNWYQSNYRFRPAIKL